MAYSMVKIYGMCDRIGNVSFPPSDGQMEFDKPYSDSLAQIMDEEARKLVDEAYERTKNLLIERSDELIGVAEKLLERETINQDDVIAIVGERPFDSADNFQDIIKQSWKRKDTTVEDSKGEDTNDETTIGGPVLASKNLYKN
jgi:AFG3 family protein